MNLHADGGTDTLDTERANVVLNRRLLKGKVEVSKRDSCIVDGMIADDLARSSALGELESDRDSEKRALK